MAGSGLRDSVPKWENGMESEETVFTGKEAHQIVRPETTPISETLCIHSGKENKNVTEQKGEEIKIGKGTQRGPRCVNENLVGNL